MKRLFLFVAIAILLVCSVKAFAESYQVMDVRRVKTGEEFNISFWADPATGAHWQLVTIISDSIIKLVSSEQIPAEKSRIKTLGEDAWTFKALAPGREVLEFRYVPAGAKNEQYIKHRRIVVLVS